MTKDEALKQALELLAVATYHSPDLQAKRTEVIDAGLKALSSGATVAQPTPPVATQHESTRVNATTWRGLTDEEAVECWPGLAMYADCALFWKNIEAKLKAKNETAQD